MTFALAKPIDEILPETAYLFGLIAPGWVVHQRLEIQIERDEFGDYVASDSQLAVHGVGTDRTSALSDYIVSLIEYFELIEIESRDHPPTASLFRRVQSYIKKSVVQS